MSHLAFAKVETTQLSHEVRKRVSRVPEFDFIIQEAKKMGIKVYLFGGTAAAFAHYVRWDLERESGDPNYQDERFDYDFTNIYRGNQDLDIVVDGTVQDALSIKAILQKRYPHFIGAKEDWEVRLLRGQIGDKLPLLDDKDFRNQHTDSNSTGMLDLTAKNGEPVFRDLLDWKNEESHFLKDVAAARITYLFNENHSETTRFKEGKNPPIFSAVRYLAKLTQYEVEGTSDDLDIIRKIVDQTNFESLSGYVQHKISEFALKTLLNSPDSEYAWNLLEDLGLRKKLIQMDGNSIDTQESLSWWMSKEPLRSKSFGRSGRTAKSIFGGDEIVLSHETKSFVAYENITRSSRGKANAFISRQGVAGEAAVHGDGFYARLGKEGAVGSGLTIRFRLHPDAREGEDFTFDGEFFVIKNKNALTLIQENINIGMIDFLKLFVSNQVNYTDQGLIEKLLRKYDRQGINSEEFKQAVLYVKNEFDFSEYGISDKEFLDISSFDKFESFRDLLLIYNSKNIDYFYQEVIAKKLSEEDPNVWLKYPKLIEKLVRSGRIDGVIVQKVLSHPSWEERIDLIQEIIDGGRANREVIQFILAKMNSPKQIEWIEYYINQKPEEDPYIAMFILSQPSSKKYYDWFKIVFSRGMAVNQIFEFVLSQEHWHDEDLIQELISQDLKYGPYIIEHILSKKSFNHRTDWVEHYLLIPEMHSYIADFILPTEWAKEEWLRQVMHENKADTAVLRMILDSKKWKNRNEYIEFYLKKNQLELNKVIMVKLHMGADFIDEELVEILLKYDSMYAPLVAGQGPLDSEKWKHKEDWIQKIIDQQNPPPLGYFISIHWIHREDWVETLVERGRDDASIVEHILTHKRYRKRMDLLDKIIKRGQVDTHIIKKLLSKGYFLNHTIFDYFLEKDLDALLAEFVVSQKHASFDPTYVEKLIDRGKSDLELVEFVFSKEYWKINPEWINKLIDRNDSNLDFKIALTFFSVKEKYFEQEKFQEILYNWIKELVNRGDAVVVSSYLHYVSKQKGRANVFNEKMISEVLSKNALHYYDIVRHILSKQEWSHKLIEWSFMIYDRYTVETPAHRLHDLPISVGHEILSQKFSLNFPDLYVRTVLSIFKTPYSMPELNSWNQHPVLLKYLGLRSNQKFEPRDIVEMHRKKDFFEWNKARLADGTFSCGIILSP